MTTVYSAYASFVTARADNKGTAFTVRAEKIREEKMLDLAVGAALYWVLRNCDPMETGESDNPADYILCAVRERTDDGRERTVWRADLAQVADWMLLTPQKYLDDAKTIFDEDEEYDLWSVDNLGYLNQCPVLDTVLFTPYLAELEKRTPSDLMNTWGQVMMTAIETEAERDEGAPTAPTAPTGMRIVDAITVKRP